ncbi:MAG: hypothetical protein IID32_05415 [Planctomycetes bacterium]|nr:hypothetical protein [Planctomycetota bacterium]
MGLKQRRKSAGMPKWTIFGEVFALFGAFFTKSGSFFAKIERNGAVFASFEKGMLVFALNRKIRTYGRKLTTNCTNKHE